MTYQIRYSEAKKITLIGAITNLLLGVAKLLGGIAFHSHALVADGLHSFSDLLIDFMVIIASKYGSHGADESHPYGHQRIETAATMILALLLIVAGLAICADALGEMITASHDAPKWLALPIAIMSVIANEILFYYTKYIGHKISSPLLIANAWHHRSDSAASLVVVVGLIASLFGMLYFDTLAAIIVGMMIVKMGLEYGWASIKELVDTGLDQQMVEKISHIIQQTDGVEKIHQLRSRLMGHNIFIDVHILVSSDITVSEGHFIAQNVHYSLMRKIENIKDVTIHVDPEDDEVIRPSLNLPTRSQLTKKIFATWEGKYPGLSCIALHYINGGINVDLLIPESLKNFSELKADIASAVQNTTLKINQIRIFKNYTEKLS